MERIVGSFFSSGKTNGNKFLFAKEESIYRVAASLGTACLKFNFKDL